MQKLLARPIAAPFLFIFGIVLLQLGYGHLQRSSFEYIPRDAPIQIISPTNSPAVYWALSAGMLVVGILLLAVSAYAVLCLVRAYRGRRNARIPQTQPLGRHHDYSGVDFDGSRHHFKVNYGAGHSTQTMQRTMPVSFTPSDIKELIAGASSRFDLWVRLLRSRPLECAAEIGVWKGDFAKVILSNFSNLTKYYMIDPWAHLPDWNKPFNVDDGTFEDVYAEALLKTDFAASRRIVLRGRTSAVIDEIADQSLDFAYIDGDHTLRGITVDLIQVLPKIKDGGLIGGDDFVNKPWQHGAAYEPTLVCPFTVYFAEAMRLPFVALPHKQFLIQKAADAGFSFVDLVGAYSDLSLKGLSQSSMGKRV